MKPENLVFFGPIMKIVDLGIAQKEMAELVFDNFEYFLLILYVDTI